MEETSFDPRGRLVGAVILVVLAVIILPMLLGHKPAQKAHQDVLVVRRSGTVFKGAPAGPHGSSAREAVSAGGARVVTPRVPVKPPKVVMATTPKARLISPLPRSARPVPVKAAAVGWDFYVQVGAYANAGGALAFGHKLAGQGFLVHTRLARLAHGRGVIVTLGPYTKLRAERVRAVVARRDGVRGIVIARAQGAK